MSPPLRGGFYLTDSGINARNFRSRASVNWPSDEVALLVHKRERSHARLTTQQPHEGQHDHQPPPESSGQQLHAPGVDGKSPKEISGRDMA